MNGFSSALYASASERCDTIDTLNFFQHFPVINRLTSQVWFRNTSCVRSAFSAKTIWFIQNDIYRKRRFISAFTFAKVTPLSITIPRSFADYSKAAILLSDFNCIQAKFTSFLNPITSSQTPLPKLVGNYRLPRPRSPLDGPQRFDHPLPRTARRAAGAHRPARRTSSLRRAKVRPFAASSLRRAKVCPPGEKKPGFFVFFRAPYAHVMR